MSVTESKAKKPGKTSEKMGAPADAAALKAALEATQTESVPLSALVKSPLNVRTLPYAAERVRELADSIRGTGLLQNLVVHRLPDGQYGVAAGGRRLAAMQLLAAETTLPPEWPVPVKVVPETLAVAASLSENAQHLEMHPAEQIAGFRALAAEGKTPAQTGDLLGYSSRHVQRMLKLAGLAPVILQALAEDTITTEHCQALALENDPERQVQVFEAACRQSWNSRPDVNTIRNLITVSEVPTHNNSKFRFVGERAFGADELRTDLFSDEQGGYVDRQALDTALLEKLRQVAEHLKEAEGWTWAAGRMDSVSHGGEDAAIYQLQAAPAAVYTEEEAQRLETLQALYDENQNASEDTAAMEAEMAAIDCAAQVRAWTPERRDGCGVVVSWQYGAVQVQRGVKLREPKENSDVCKPDADGGTEKTPEPVDAISLPLLTRMSSERTLAVQAALMQQPEKAVALLAWTLCQNVFGSGAYSGPARISLTCKHYALTSDAPSGENGAAFTALMQEKLRLEALLPAGWRQDFSTFFTLGGSDLLSLLGFCTACSLDGVQTRENGHTTRSPLGGLEAALAFHLRDWWQPTADTFFRHLKKPQIVAALDEAGLAGGCKGGGEAEKRRGCGAGRSADGQHPLGTCLDGRSGCSGCRLRNGTRSRRYCGRGRRRCWLFIHP